MLQVSTNRKGWALLLSESADSCRNLQTIRGRQRGSFTKNTCSLYTFAGAWPYPIGAGRQQDTPGREKQNPKTGGRTTGGGTDLKRRGPRAQARPPAAPLGGNPRNPQQRGEAHPKKTRHTRARGYPTPSPQSDRVQGPARGLYAGCYKPPPDPQTGHTASRSRAEPANIA